MQNLSDSQKQLLYSIIINGLQFVALRTPNKIDDYIILKIKEAFPPMPLLTIKQSIIESLTILAKESDNKVDDTLIKAVEKFFISEF